MCLMMDFFPSGGGKKLNLLALFELGEKRGARRWMEFLNVMAEISHVRVV